MACVEYETSFNITLDYIPPAIANMKPVEKYVISYYPNNIRLHNLDFQIKKKFSTKNILLYLQNGLDNFFLPVKRTIAEEKLTTMPQNIDTVETIILRVVYYKNSFEMYDSNINIRFCVEHVSTDNSMQIQFTGEVEYDKSIIKHHKHLMEIEKIFTRTLLKNFPDLIIYLKNTNILFSSPPDMISIRARVFQMFHNKCYSKICTDNMMFKYDGYKGYLYMDDDEMMHYYDVMGTFRNFPAEDLNLYFAKNIVFQFEIMQEIAPGNKYHSLIITDVIGGYIKNDLYRPEPRDAIAYLETYCKEFTIPEYTSTCLHTNEVVRFNIFPQKIIGNDDVTKERYDGYIIINGTALFKFKKPTLDVRIINGNLHLKDTANAITSVNYNRYEDGVYEITLPNGNPKSSTINGITSNIAYVILRKRVDRCFPSTLSEYVAFQNEVDFYRQRMYELQKFYSKK